MKDIRIVFFDIDGTLLVPHAGQISPQTRQALLGLREKGIRICIATGRAPAYLPDFGDIPFDAYVTYNGSYCFHSQGTILSNPLSSQDVQTLIQNATAIGRPVSLATKDRLAANGVDRDLADYYALSHLTLESADDFEAVTHEDIYQLMLGCREGDFPAIMQNVRNAKIAISWDRAIDIIPADGGKGAGIRQVLRHFGLDSSQALAFGDSHNDIEMLQAVGTGVAMGNASNELKAVADDVCARVEEDGIYRYCLTHGLIGIQKDRCK